MVRVGSLVRRQYLKEIHYHFFEPLFVGPLKAMAWRGVLDTDMMYFSRFPEELGKVSVGFGSRSTSVVDVGNANRKTTISIGKFVHFGKNVRILDTLGHDLESISFANLHASFGYDIPESEIHNRGPIVIGNDVGIADNVTIMGNTTIPDGANVGTMSLVRGNLEPFGLYGGSPARLIRYRFEPGVISRLLKLAWWDLPPEVIWKHRALLTSPKVEEALPALERIAQEVRASK